MNKKHYYFIGVFVMAIGVGISAYIFASSIGSGIFIALEVLFLFQFTRLSIKELRELKAKRQRLHEKLKEDSNGKKDSASGIRPEEAGQEGY